MGQVRGAQEKVPGVCEGSSWANEGLFLASVLQHGLVALENTLRHLRSSALQRDLRERGKEPGECDSTSKSSIEMQGLKDASTSSRVHENPLWDVHKLSQARTRCRENQKTSVRVRD